MPAAAARAGDARSSATAAGKAASAARLPLVEERTREARCRWAGLVTMAKTSTPSEAPAAPSKCAAAPGALVVGLDISRAMLEVAAQRARGYSNVVLVRADAHKLPFTDGSFAGVNNAGALHAYDDAEQVLREVRRVLRPGGVLVGSTFAQAPTLVGRVTARLAGIRRYDPGELRAQLARLGFAEYEELRLGGAFVFRARRP